MQLKKEKRIKTHTKLNILITLLSVILMASLVSGYMMYTDTHYKKEFYQMKNNHIDKNLRMVFLTDLHQHEYGNANDVLIDDIKGLKPDLIISGGDLIIADAPDYDDMLKLCEELAKIAPFYGVLGNHEDQRIYFGNDKELRQKFESTGLKLLVNQIETVTLNGNSIELVGLAGTDSNFEKYGAKEFMDSLPPKSAAIRICVAHVPMLFKSKLLDYSFDLGLSGHVHGGLIKLPRIGGVYSDEEGFLPELYSGWYELDNAPLIVSRGMGDSRSIPRINNSHELSIIDFKWY